MIGLLFLAAAFLLLALLFHLTDTPERAARSEDPIYWRHGR